MNLLKQLPPVLRARDFHLYLEGGIRLVDLWLYGGRCVLGHKPPNTIRELKKSAERGLFAPFPNVYEKRFVKALAKLFHSTPGEPKQYFRIYNSKASLMDVLERQGISLSAIAVWRPFLEKKASCRCQLMSPVLPWPLAPTVLVFDKTVFSNKTNEENFLEGDIISPVILAPATRAIHDLLAAETTRGKLSYSKINKALNTPECKWRRQGIYLTRKQNTQEDWSSLWKQFFENGFLLPPDPCDPLILPGELSPGEETKLAGLLKI